MKKNFKRLVALVLALIILVPSFASAAERVKLKDALVVGENAYTLDYLAKNSSEVNKAVNKELAKANARIYYVHPSGKAQDLEGKDVNQKDHEVTLHKADGTTEKYKDGFKVEGQTPAPAPQDHGIKVVKPNIKIALSNADIKRDMVKEAKATLEGIPEGAKVEWSKYPFNGKLGTDVPGQVLVTLKDGQKIHIDVKVDITKLGEVLADKIDPIVSKIVPKLVKNSTDEIENFNIIEDKDQILQKIFLDEEFKKEYGRYIKEVTLYSGKQTFANAGDYKNELKIVYRDDSLDFVEVPVKVYNDLKPLLQDLVKEGRAFKEMVMKPAGKAENFKPNDVIYAATPQSSGYVDLSNFFTEEFKRYAKKVEVYEIRDMANTPVIENGQADTTDTLELDAKKGFSRYKAMLNVIGKDDQLTGAGGISINSVHKNIPLEFELRLEKDTTTANEFNIGGRFTKEPRIIISTLLNNQDINIFKKTILYNETDSQKNYAPFDDYLYTTVFISEDIKYATRGGGTGANAELNNVTSANAIKFIDLPNLLGQSGKPVFKEKGKVTVYYTGPNGDGTHDTVYPEFTIISSMKDFVEAKSNGYIATVKPYESHDNMLYALKKSLNLQEIVDKLTSTGLTQFNVTVEDPATRIIDTIEGDISKFSNRENEPGFKTDQNKDSQQIEVEWETSPNLANPDSYGYAYGVGKVIYPDKTYDLVDITVKVEQ